ncbi:1882_t:CDS:2 [Ambispora leptoticha]|uniref:1882_t:CDS:1 n=1 Tax=Ambispora leptoticha TaxID=144679 RepID=A0A9N9CV91_9GLOM|nr:1882_t:CDS:2 [Ambispora leptoticha]
MAFRNNIVSGDEVVFGNGCDGDGANDVSSDTSPALQQPSPQSTEVSSHKPLQTYLETFLIQCSLLPQHALLVFEHE